MLLFIKPRIPVTLSSSTHERRRHFDYGFVLSPAFLALQAGNIFQGLGYFIPGIYLPSYAHSLGMSGAVSTATIALLNITGVFGCIFVGVLIDHLHVTTVLFILALGSLVSVIVLWGLFTSVPLLLTFSAVYGFFAGPFTTTYTGVVREVRKHTPNAETGLIMGLLSAGRGIGSVASGPLSQALLSDSYSKATVNVGYDTGYWSLITFTGVSVALGGFGFWAKRLGWL
jgi:MFS family permease